MRSDLIPGVPLMDSDFHWCSSLLETVDGCIYCELVSVKVVGFGGFQLLTLPVHVSGHVKLGDIIGRRRFQPDGLPDATARRVEDVSWVQRLLANGNDMAVAVRRIMHENQSRLSMSSGMTPRGLAGLTIHYPCQRTHDQSLQR